MESDPSTCQSAAGALRQPTEIQGGAGNENSVVSDIPE